MKNQTRRKFIIDSVKITGTSLFTTTLGQGLLVAQASEAANIKFPESNCGGKNKGVTKFWLPMPVSVEQQVRLQ